MELEIINILVVLLGFILSSATIKTIRVYPLLKQIYTLMKLRREVKKDGTITIKEKARLYDEIVILNEKAWLVIKGFLPNKSKN